MSSTEKLCNHLLIFSVKFEAIHRNCHKALNNQRCLKQTKAKTKEYQVKLVAIKILTAPPVSYKNQKYQLILKNSEEETEKYGKKKRKLSCCNNCLC